MIEGSDMMEYRQPVYEHKSNIKQKRNDPRSEYPTQPNMPDHIYNYASSDHLQLYTNSAHKSVDCGHQYAFTPVHQPLIGEIS